MKFYVQTVIENCITMNDLINSLRPGSSPGRAFDCGIDWNGSQRKSHKLDHAGSNPAPAIMKFIEGSKCNNCGCIFAFDQGENKPPKCSQCGSDFNCWFAKGQEPKNYQDLFTEEYLSNLEKDYFISYSCGILYLGAKKIHATKPIIKNECSNDGEEPERR